MQYFVQYSSVCCMHTSKRCLLCLHSLHRNSPNGSLLSTYPNRPSADCSQQPFNFQLSTKRLHDFLLSAPALSLSPYSLLPLFCPSCCSVLLGPVRLFL